MSAVFKENKRDRGEVAVVTGGAVRLGRAICIALSEAGFRVAIHHNSSARQAEELAQALASAGADARVFQKDLLMPDACGELLEEILSTWGRLDFFVNNAALFYPDDAEPERLAAMRRLNEQVPKRFGAAARDRLLETRGCLVNIADVLALTATTKHKIYAASKKELLDWTIRFAEETAPQGIRVNAVAPGLILPSAKDARAVAALVDKVPMKRLGSPADVASAVAFLSTADYVTGQILFVDGGRHLSPAGREVPV